MITPFPIFFPVFFFFIINWKYTTEFRKEVHELTK